MSNTADSPVRGSATSIGPLSGKAFGAKEGPPEWIRCTDEAYKTSAINFNIGVESGQLIVAAALLPVLWTIRSRPVWNARLMPLCSVVITVAGSYCLLRHCVEARVVRKTGFRDEAVAE